MTSVFSYNCHLSLVAIALLIRVVKLIPVDNGVIGESPEIECNNNHVTISFNTEKTFEGHVYVKGNYDEGACRADSTGRRSASIQVPFDKCGVRRSRSLNPPGLATSVTVIITFHPQFLTKVDRAYHVRCFYMEADKTVTNQIDVSMLTTNLISQAVVMPVCRYEVLAGATDNEALQPMKFARIGDKSYHKWSCLSESIDTFCMTVHSCFVSDGADKRVQLLDENGCAQDKYLLQNVEYSNDLVGGRESHVFKFADRPTLFFNCQIRLGLKRVGATNCERSSDNCVAPQRGKRNVHDDEFESLYNIDVFTDDVNVLDQVPLEEYNNDDTVPSTFRTSIGDYVNHQSRETLRHTQLVCVSPLLLGLVCTLAAVVFCSLTLVIWAIMRKRRSIVSMMKSQS